MFVPLRRPTPDDIGIPLLAAFPSICSQRFQEKLLTGVLAVVDVLPPPRIEERCSRGQVGPDPFRQGWRPHYQGPKPLIGSWVTPYIHPISLKAFGQLIQFVMRDRVLHHVRIDPMARPTRARASPQNVQNPYHAKKK